MYDTIIEDSYNTVSNILLLLQKPVMYMGTDKW